MGDHVSRQVQTGMRKIQKKKLPQTEAWGEQEDARREKRTEPAQLYPPVLADVDSHKLPAFKSDFCFAFASILHLRKRRGRSQDTVSVSLDATPNRLQDRQFET